VAAKQASDSQLAKERREHLVKVLSIAIRRADDSWHDEDYLKQARAVMEAIHEVEFEVVPAKPSRAAVTKTVQNMPYGANLNPIIYFETLYKLMLVNTHVFYGQNKPKDGGRPDLKPSTRPRRRG